MKFRNFRADLHIHSCLSPCADVDMSPLRIAAEARRKGLDIIAVCDHNSAENTRAAQVAAGKSGIMALAGIEICTAEEVHIIGLFDEWDQAVAVQEVVYDHLQPGGNDPEVFGMQVVANETDEVLGFNSRLLIGCVGLSLERVLALIHKNRGLAIACHIDREGFGILGQLGFIPPGLPLDAVEISCRTSRAEAKERFRDTAGLPWIQSSDAHHLEDIGCACTEFRLGGLSLDELRLALLGKDGRGHRPFAGEL